MVGTKNLFISHSWAYGDSYNNLIRMLNAAPYFSFRDYSVPKHDPIHHANNAIQLRAAIRNQMSRCQCVIIMAGVYATYSKWINIEIELAKRDFNKPVLGIRPHASTRVSDVVRRNADEMVSWSTTSIVGAIRRLC